METAELKVMTRSAYDMQDLRIRVGNRLTMNFKAKLGQAPGEKEDTIDEDAKQILASLRQAYEKRITDGVVKFTKLKHFEGDEVISSYGELHLTGYYLSLVKAEETLFKAIAEVLDEYPIWTEFLDGVKGVGRAMGGVIISEFDIHKARYPSSLHAYAGLDVVGEWKLGDIKHAAGDRVAAEAWIQEEGNVSARRPFVGTIDPPNIVFCDGETVLKISQDKQILAPVLKPILNVLHTLPTFSVLAQYEWNGYGGRSRRRAHLREVEYTDKDGKPATKVGITFNPFLKTKLLGVLASSFLRVGRERSPYAVVYYDYKHRMENHEKHGIQNDKLKDANGRGKASKGHRHNMAMRYMVKMFLIDLYKHWRKLEGLPVHPPYHEAKLGLKHAV